MYICMDCGREYEDLDELDSWVEPHGEHLSGCVKCGGDVEEAEYCDYCNKLTPKYNIKYLRNSQCCDNCYEAIADEFMKRLKDSLKDFIEENEEVINDYFEENEFQV